MSRHFRVRVHLLGTEPPVWRLIDLPAHLTVRGLHELLFAAMGWSARTDFALEIGTRRLGSVNPDNLWQVGERVDATVADLFSRSSQGLHYIHDLEVMWEHALSLEQVVERETDLPVCVDGAGACPPDHAGGAATFRHLLEALANPGHREHHKAQAVLGPDFDPLRFDRERCNAAIAAAVHEDWLEQDAPFADEEEALAEPLASAYDADRGPAIDLWLALPQADMVTAIEHYHRRQHLRRRSEALRAHAVLHMAVETQIAEGEPAEARAALERLLRQGLDRHESVHALAAVLSAQLGQALQNDRFDDAGYARDLRSVDAASWRREKGLGLIPAVMKRGLRARNSRRRGKVEDPA